MCDEIETTREHYPCGPCRLPLKCCNCGMVITEENVVEQECGKDEYGYECEICKYCGNGKCPSCGEHWHCGGCV